MMQKVAWMAFIVFFAAAAVAQVPKGNVFFGYSYMRADTNSTSLSNLNGWNGSIEGKIFPSVGLVADFSGHYGVEPTNKIVCVTVVGVICPTSVDAKAHTFLFGPRVSISIGGVRPFAHVLIGGAHTSEHAEHFSFSDTSFATAIGGGADFRLSQFLGWRVQGDWVNTRFFSTTQNDARISTGLDLRF